jgi:hypothetical protein
MGKKTKLPKRYKRLARLLYSYMKLDMKLTMLYVNRLNEALTPLTTPSTEEENKTYSWKLYTTELK